MGHPAGRLGAGSLAATEGVGDEVGRERWGALGRGGLCVVPRVAHARPAAPPAPDPLILRRHDPRRAL